MTPPSQARMITMADALAQIDEVAGQAESELAAVKDAGALEQYRIKFLGSNGLVRNLARLIAEAPKEQKRAVGQRVNEAKRRVEELFNTRKQGLAADVGSDRDYVDVTEPGLRPRIGNRHILMKVVDELTGLFGRMGFSVATGPEVEDDFHNFVALNIPESHPARDPLDNFYLESSSRQGQLLLRTQTSTVQVRVMQTQTPPIRVVIPGRVYRPDTTDATHLPMFHQLEALVVDRHVTMVDLKSTVMQFIHAYFGPATRVRFRPSFFPFTEPSAEVDVWFEDKQRWIELGGCGMVHPNVFKNCGIDPEEYSGWAFGLGIERIAMRKYGIQDIRSFVENDIRFLRQF
jgi:phenylalanyl-tRNA synthetase alpha chain